MQLKKMEDVTFLGVEMGSLGFRARQCCNCLKIRFKKLSKYESVIFVRSNRLIIENFFEAFKNCAR
jgi:hypothetical protein